MRVTIRFVPGLKVTIDLVESLAVGPCDVEGMGDVVCRSCFPGNARKRDF